MTGRPLRILYHHRTAAADGMQVHVAAVVAALRARGHLVEVVGPGGGARDGRAAGSGLERMVERLRRHAPAAAYEALELLYNLPAYMRLAAAARVFAPDVIYERYNLFLLAGLWLARSRRLPLLLEVNSPLATERARFGGLRLRGAARRCEAALWRGASAVLPVSHVLARRVGRVRGARRGVHVVPNGADLARPPPAGATARLRERLALPPGALVLGFVGFVRPWHGVGWALEALPGLPEHTHLVVVGEGPALAPLRARAQALGLGARVHLPGAAPHGEVRDHMAAFDIALQAAATAYASPLKLLEYMAMGLPILAPDQRNIRELLTCGHDALLFEPRSETSFRSALARLCLDPALRARLGAQARRTVAERPLTWAHNAARIEGLAYDLLDRRAPRAEASARRALSAGV